MTDDIGDLRKIKLDNINSCIISAFNKTTKRKYIYKNNLKPMNKTLLSGILVNADEYYKLLEWKDTHYYSFHNWCMHNIPEQKMSLSINKLSLYKYNLLLEYAKQNGLNT